MLSDKVFFLPFAAGMNLRSTFGYREVECWRTGLFSLPPFYRDRRSERSPSCVRCLRPRCEGRRSGPSRRLTVRLDTSDNGLGTALPFPGVARLPEAQTSQPGGRSVAIRRSERHSIERVSVGVTKAFAVSLRGSRSCSPHVWLQGGDILRCLTAALLSPGKSAAVSHQRQTPGEPPRRFSGPVVFGPETTTPGRSTPPPTTTPGRATRYAAVGRGGALRNSGTRAADPRV